jgi:hypothetical protein
MSNEPENLHWAKVLVDLRRGELDSLADYLLQSNGSIGLDVAAYLVVLIRGSKQETGWRLSISNHPDVARNENGREDRFAEYALNFKMAFFIADRDGWKRGRGKAAFADAAKEFGLSANYIRERVAPYKEIASRKAGCLKEMRSKSRILPTQKCDE